ncbi:squalene/phytoene synthase family protein [Streptomyces sp. NPDC005573]|uniref:squalene/phytoene synthase family protein n=1 Tax=Streptomyces sp. NPDC005573 TaxID=3156890 RepID=UPI00339DFA9B
MPRWSAALTEAGIGDARLRRDFDVQRRLVRRYRREEYLAVRLLLPAGLRPHVVAVVAFMHETDRRIDLGDARSRQDALRAWSEEVRDALDGAESGQPALRALVEVVRQHPELGSRVRDFMNGAPVEAAWRGFGTEADFQDYVDRYSMAALMLTACLIGPGPGTGTHEPFVQGCRKLIEAMQRTDFLADLPEDLEEGRVGVPADALARQGLDFGALRERPQESVSAMAEVVDGQVALAAEAFGECRDLPTLAEPRYRPFLRALVSVQELRLRAVEQAGGSLLGSGADPSLTGAVRVLWREYRAVRRVRG